MGTVNKKTMIIVGVLAVDVVLFCAAFRIASEDQANAEYAREQDDALTHDVTPIAQLGPISLGDNNGVRELFGALPLHSVDRKYEIDAEHESLTINYLEVVGDIGVDDVRRDLIYNSVVAMAAIPNLSDITYNFVGDGYSFTREEIEDVFGKRLPDLLASSGEWQTEVRSRLASQKFCQQFYA